MKDLSKIRSKIREHMGVVTLDDREIGVVSYVDDDTLRVTSFKDGQGFSYLVPLSWVGAVDKYVFLDRGSAYVAANSRIATITSRPKAA